MDPQTGERKTPRKKFSFDSIRPRHIRRSSSEGGHDPGEQKHSKHTKFATLGQVEEEAGRGSAGGDGKWLPAEISESPSSIHFEEPKREKASDKKQKSQASSSKKALNPINVDGSNTSDGMPPPSPSSIRWNSIRQHVIPAAREEPTPSHSASTSTSSLNIIPPRTQTPKPSRLAHKFGFRQVVDQAREVAEDDTRKFEIEIRKACWNVRGLAETIPPSSKATAGSTLYLPFMSSTSLAAAAASATPISNSTKKGDLRRPQSIQTLAEKGRATGSLSSLYQVLTLYAGYITNGGPQMVLRLPNEGLVLSTLLYPFFVPDSPVVEEERVLALRAFDVILRTWNPFDEIVAAERAIFCTKVVLLLCPDRNASSSSPPQTPLRMHALNALYNITASPDTAYPAYNPRSFITLIHGLFALLPATQRCEPQQSQGQDNGYEKFGPQLSPEERKVTEILQQIRGGSCGELDNVSVEEEYNALFVDKDNAAHVRDAILLEAWAKCVEFGSNELRRALIRRGVEEYWSLSKVEECTPMIVAIKSRMLDAFTRAAVSLLSSTVVSTSPAVQAAPSTPSLLFSASDPRALDEQARQIREIDGTLIVWALQTRVFTELETLQEAASNGNATMEKTKKNVVRIVLELLMLRTDEKLNPNEQEQQRFSTGDGEGQLVAWAVSTIGAWCREKDTLRWRGALDAVVNSIVTDGQWTNVLRVTSAIVSVLPEEIRKSILMTLLPILHDRLVNNPPQSPSDNSQKAGRSSTPERTLTSLLDNISRLYPQIFYKPLFSLAASSKEIAVANHLCSLVGIARWLPDFWVRDAEMIAVAVMSDLSGKGKNQSSSPVSERKEFAVASLGQSVILVEIISKIQKARKEREIPALSSQHSISESMLVELIKFALALEARLALLIEAKEKTSLVPLSQRLLFTMLFREIRLLTRSLKSAKWLPRFVSWFIQYHKEREDYDDETMKHISLIQTAYATAREGARPSHQKHRSTLVMSPSVEGRFPTLWAADNATGIAASFAEKADLLNGLAKGYARRALKLMVAMSGVISLEDYTRIGGLLWNHHMDESDPSVLTSTCFLIMQCAEKTPLDFLANIEVDLQSLNDVKRHEAMKKFSTLTSWRFQIMAQPMITDRSHRPFKMARGPLQFVSTDMGSSLFVLEIDASEVKDKLPLELRKQLAEIGWESDDSPVNQQLEWIKTPMTNLPALQMDRVESGGGGLDSLGSSSSPNLSPLSSPKSSPTLESEKAEEISLLRRNSSSGGPLAAMKRRAIFVPALGKLLPRIAVMMFDSNIAVATTTRSLIIDLMRNDPQLLTRPIWDLLAGDQHDFSMAITTLSAFLHVRRILPPAMAHTVFNHLAGFLKFASKQLESEDAVHKYARIMPVMSKLATQVTGISIREMRRAKLEVFFVPSGSLWFPSTAPTGPMFPRGPGFDNPFEHDIPARLVSVTLIRITQNILFLSMLKRNPAEVQVVRKNMVRLVLPSREASSEAAPLELKDFAPRRPATTAFEKVDLIEFKTRGLSLILSRSYLLLVAQVFRSMSRHLNDRNELAVLIDGVNRILLAHGKDIGIISHALIALMVASTRFRRLFASGGGYILFMPAIIKVYAECEDHEGIRHAIEYAVNRFYAHHQETFVFQSLSAVSHIFLLPSIEGEWVAKHVYTLFASLRQSIPPTVPDEAGIRGANKLQEREALIVTTAEEKPQTFFAAFRGKEESEKPSLPADFPQEYESKRLGIDDLVRLFLTVIAHDLSIARAEQFLKTLRFLAPHFHDATPSARNVLQEGVDALGVILSRATRTKPFDPTTSQVGDAIDIQTISTVPGYEQHLADRTKEPSDIVAMRLDYLHLVVAFTRAGGKMTAAASRMTFELVKNILREPASPSEAIASILGDYLRNSLLTKDGRSLKAVIHTLRDLAPVISGYASSLNLSSVLDTITELCSNPTYSNDITFSHLIVNQICGACLVSCEQAAANKLLHVLPWRSAMIRLMAAATLLRGADIFVELRRHQATYELLTYVVLPLSLTIKTTAELELDNISVDPLYRQFQARTWVRMLSYTLACCERSQTPEQASSGISLTRSRSRDSRSSRTDSKSQLAALLLTLQVVKVLFIRAEKELTSCLPDVWMRLGGLLRTILADGNAEFVLQTKDSPSPSPTPSPRASGQFDFTSAPDMTRPLSLGGRSYQSPRFADYCLWSISELLCVYRTPLFLQLRAFMHEKVHTFDRERRYQEDILHLPSPRPRRPSSVFSKPRLRLSNTPSPESSPRMRPTNPFEAGDGGFNSLRPGSLSIGYHTISPSTPPTLSPRDSSSSGPRIVHLGPVSPSQTVFRRSLSPIGGARLAMADSTRVRSLTLIRKTYLRIRAVQNFMGYPPLQMPNTGSANALGDDFSVPGEIERGTQVWTKAKALREVVQETQELVDEFDEGAGEDNESEGVFVNVGDESFGTPGVL
ncbi:unc-80-like protein [Moniliophthora roreri MCA 2997]|uniref:Unc-80-like protein n=1 Tax=Moniliophthora roreri (strain MCA 2997) TaxID=1381753 RepID=V2X7F4_MONRO|nr:unc-80-like protein [Moniliophthora roreri MCA 2997]